MKPYLYNLITIIHWFMLLLIKKNQDSIQSYKICITTPIQEKEKRTQGAVSIEDNSLTTTTKTSRESSQWTEEMAHWQEWSRGTQAVAMINFFFN